MYKYYRTQKILPTYAGFKTRRDLNAYGTQRAAFFRDKLRLPPRLFAGMQLIEFGPDSGENALVFARWGAELTLVEPNLKAWDRINAYFRKFGLEKSLRVSLTTTLEDAKLGSRKYDLIDAEGFIHTVRPTTNWLRLFDRILAADGLAVISYYERSGAFLELFFKLIFTRIKEITGKGPLDAAWQLYQTKWNSILHTRSFESWVMDVLGNPYVREKFFLDSEALCVALDRHGFGIYSSWPNYADSLAVYWHKRHLPPREHLVRTRKALARNRLSFLLGRKAFLCAVHPDRLAKINDRIRETVRLTDQLIGGFDSSKARRLVRQLAALQTTVKGSDVLTDMVEDRKWAASLLGGMQNVIRNLMAEDVEAVCRQCNSDRLLINAWGMPHHYAVIQRTG